MGMLPSSPACGLLLNESGTQAFSNVILISRLMLFELICSKYIFMLSQLKHLMDTFIILSVFISLMFLKPLCALHRDVSLSPGTAGCFTFCSIDHKLANLKSTQSENICFFLNGLNPFRKKNFSVWTSYKCENSHCNDFVRGK